MAKNVSRTRPLHRRLSATSPVTGYYRDLSRTLSTLSKKSSELSLKTRGILMVLTTWFLLMFGLAAAVVPAMASRHRRTQVERREAQGLVAALENWLDDEPNAGIYYE